MAQLSRMAELGVVGRHLSTFGISAASRVPESRRSYSLLQRQVVRQSIPRRRLLSPKTAPVHIALRRASTEQSPKPRRRFPVLRWIWRLTYLSALGGLAFVGYQVYTLRYPIDQFEPDPNKKTLVILGTWRISGALGDCGGD